MSDSVSNKIIFSERYLWETPKTNLRFEYCEWGKSKRPK